ncbi:hypothetical protein [Planctomycetes bacterium Poly30]
MTIVTRTRLLSLAVAPALVSGLMREAAAQEPPLPPGLGGESKKQSEPSLPPGLGGTSRLGDEPGLPPGLEPSEPSLPPGLDGGSEDVIGVETVGQTGLLSFAADHGIKGFLEGRFGTRTQRDPHERTASIAEMRLRLEAERQAGSVFLRGATDLIVDPLFDSWAPDLESGQGFVDLREAYASFSPLPWLDVKAGRQVLTWGTGDLPFINDLFPKDWVSFFVGRDDEYLKAPSDAIRVGIFSDVANVDLVYTPRFDADRFIRGDRISYYNPLLGRPAGRDAPLQTDQPDEWIDDSEWSARIYRNVGGYELAAYGYLGYWKSPSGFDPLSGQARFPRLAAYGASARTQLAGGIASLEVGYYDSREDEGGDDPFVDNSQTRVLVGFERDLPEIAHSFSVGAQYYLEAMSNHDEYERTLPNGIPLRDEYRHVIILRASKLLLEQRMRASIFTYTSPSDRDTYIKPNVSYTIDDSWTLTVGANIFAGADDYTFIGQFGPNTNVFAALRLSF